MTDLKVWLQRAREGAGLDMHDRRALDRLDQLGTLAQEVGGSGGAASLVSLTLLDLSVELDKMEAGYEVVVGDWNVRHIGGKARKWAAGRRNTSVVQGFAQSRGLVEPLKGRLDRGLT